MQNAWRFWNAKTDLEYKKLKCMQKVRKLKNEGENMVSGSVMRFQFEVANWSKEFKQSFLKCSLSCQSTI